MRNNYVCVEDKNYKEVISELKDKWKKSIFGNYSDQWFVSVTIHFTIIDDYPEQNGHVEFELYEGPGESYVRNINHEKAKDSPHSKHLLWDVFGPYECRDDAQDYSLTTE